MWKRRFKEAAMRFMAVIPLSTKVDFGYIVDRNKYLLQRNLSQIVETRQFRRVYL